MKNPENPAHPCSVIHELRVALGDEEVIDVDHLPALFNPQLAETLIEPTYQASLLRYSWPGKDSRGLLLFANPAATPTGDWGSPRHRLTVRLSHNDGKSWSVSKLVEAGPAAYSSLARLPDARIGIVYESGNYKQITFAAFDLGWLSPRE